MLSNSPFSLRHRVFVLKFSLAAAYEHQQPGLMLAGTDTAAASLAGSARLAGAELWKWKLESE